MIDSIFEQSISLYISVIINVFAGIYVWNKILYDKINLKDSKLYTCFIILVILSTANYIFANSFIRFLTATIFISLVTSIIYNVNIKKSFICTVIEQILMLFSEIVFTFVTIVIFKLDAHYLVSEVKGALVTNISISLICIVLCNIKFVKKLYKKIVNSFDLISSNVLYMVIVFIIFSMNIFLLLVYSEISIMKTLIINTLFIIAYAFILYLVIKEKSENVKYKEQNKMLIDNLNEYEKMLDYQRVNNHENKNQLLVIRGMIDKTNTKALEYLDEVIKEKREDDEGIYTSASIIPQGGLQGLVYQKMLKMKENNITINLKVERKVRKINLDNLPSKTNYDLCRAVGIIIDNAIEENLNLKEREILICMYILDEYLVIEVSNKCSVIPDMTRLDEKGYTTKSNGHGYGLSLLKEIVDSNKNIINERSINKDIFTQIIKIKK